MFDLNSELTVHGEHNGIQLVSNEDAINFYYSVEHKRAAMNSNGLSKVLDCDVKTVNRVVNRLIKAGDSKYFIKREVYTPYGIKLVTLIVDKGLALVLDDIRDNKRIKQSTRDNAAELNRQLVEAGFRLAVMLRVAPEQVAREAMHRIENPEVAEKLADDAAIYAQLKRSDFAINYECKHPDNDIPAGVVVGKNNLATGLPYAGGRSKANVRQQNWLAGTQLHQADMLNAARKSDNDYTKQNKLDITDAVREIRLAGENQLAILKAKIKGN